MVACTEIKLDSTPNSKKPNSKTTTTFQEVDLLMPSKWLDMRKLEEILVKVETLVHSAKTEFRKYRGSYINETISVVVNEQFETGDACISDYVDTAIANKGIVYTCFKCGNTYEKTQTCCPSCKNDPDNHGDGYDPYFRTESKHSSQKSLVHIGEPCMVNPNYIATVREVVEHVLDIPRVKDPEHPRKWTIMHSDGVPYVYASELQDNLFVFNICGEEINKGDIRCEMWNTFLDEHTQKCFGSFELLFGNIMFVPGPGHIELNLARLLLRFLWQPFLSHFVKCLGFRTHKARQVVLNGVDHHLSKQLLSSCFEALSKELLVPYIRYCLEKGEEASNDGYQDWVDNFIDDPTYMFLYHVTFTYLLGFYLYNEATRKNHSLRMMAVRVQCYKLFFSFNHRKY